MEEKRRARKASTALALFWDRPMPESTVQQLITRCAVDGAAVLFVLNSLHT